MKTSFFKFIFSGTLTALLAVACTNDVVQPGAEDGVAVRISADAGGLQKPGAGNAQGSTRATNDVWNAGDVIGVTMVNPQSLDVMSPYRNFGYTTPGDGKFSPNDAGQIIYFPTNDAEVTFRAYYPYKKDLAPNLVIPVSVKDQKVLADIDLMTAEHLSGTSTADPNVKLHFHHRLAKVVVNLTTDNAGISILNGAQLVMKGLKTEAVYDLLDEKLVVENNLPDADVAIPVANAKGEAIILPRPAGEGVEFEITTTDGGKYRAALSSDFELKAGYVHTFHIRLKSPAEISATIEPWIEGPERNFDVIRVVTGLGITEGFEADHELDLFLKEGTDPDFGLLRKFTYAGNNIWTPDAPIYWESITGNPAIFRGATILEDALNTTQMADILISKDIEVTPYTGVNLEMEHVGSKVTVVLQSSDGTFTSTDLNSASILFPGYLNSGSYNDKGEFVPGTGRGNITPEEGIAIFPPQTVANGDNIVVVTINGRLYEVKAGETAGFVYEKGTHYTLILDARKAAVEMSAIIKPWEEETRKFNEIRVGATNLGPNEGDLVDGDALYLFTGSDTDRASLPGRFEYNEATDTWVYSGPSAPLYWEDIANTGNIYGSITRPAISTAANNNQSPDYITATPIENKGGTDNTALNFKLAHRVAKVNVMLRTTTYEEHRLLNANVTLPGYTIGGGLDKGIYVPGSSTGTITLDKPVKDGSGSETTYNTAAYLQPQIINVGQDLVTVVIDGHSYTVKPEDVKNADAAAIEYEAGKVTNLIITIEKTGLSVSVEITDWIQKPALNFNDALFFSVANQASSGFQNGDEIGFYSLGSAGNVLQSRTYVYTGNQSSGSLNLKAGETPWYRDDFNTGDKISAVFPTGDTTTPGANGTFEWTSKDGTNGVTNAPEHDILVATGNIAEGTANVSLNFRHVLSKVTVNLFNGDGFTPGELAGHEISLLGFQLTGDVNINTGIATPKGTATASFIPTQIADNTVDGKTAVASYEAFIMPQPRGDGNKTAIIGVELNGRTYNAEINHYDFKAGENHVFNITLKKTGLVFSATVDPWHNGTGGSIIIQ